MRFIGNKESIADQIDSFIESNVPLNSRLTLFDAFCGTGSVSDRLKDKYDIIINDNLKWATVYTAGRLYAPLCYFKKLGFDGKSIINPRQIEVVNEVFAPKEKDIQKSLTILAAIKEAEKKGSGVIAVNGKMVDRPVVLRAQRTIDLAIASGILTKEDIQ